MQDVSSCIVVAICKRKNELEVESARWREPKSYESQFGVNENGMMVL